MVVRCCGVSLLGEILLVLGCSIITMLIVTILICIPPARIGQTKKEFISELFIDMYYAIKQKEFWYIFGVCIVLWIFVFAMFHVLCRFFR